jgi:aryl-alcohol dehydrogenase-like predicted oxidoreductase
MVEDMIAPGGSLTLADGLTLSRMGFGAMQLAGPGVWGPPRDRAAAVAVLRAAVDAGVTPFFPLGGFSPLQSGVLDDVAAQVDATPRQVALAWLLQRSPTMLLIPGTSSVAHLRENLAAVDVVLPPAAVATLDRIAVR